MVDNLRRNHYLLARLRYRQRAQAGLLFTLCVLLSSLREVLHDGQGGSRGGPGGHGGGGVLVPSGLHHGLLLLLLPLLLRRDLGLFMMVRAAAEVAPVVTV